MEPSKEIHIIYIVVLLIVATNGHHFLRGCQDVDPKCALLDEMRAGGCMVKICIIHIEHLCVPPSAQIPLWRKKCAMLGQITTAPSHAIDARAAKTLLC